MTGQFKNVALSCLTLLLFHQACLCQSVRIVSKLDGNPLPFATISNISKRIIYSADDKGFTTFKGSLSDSLQISHVGYETLKIRRSSVKDSVVNLIPLIEVLNPLVVTPCKSRIELVRNNFKTKNVRKSGFLWAKTLPTTIFAIPVISGDRLASLKEFSFWLEKENGSPQFSLTTPLLVSFFSTRIEDSLPGYPLTPSPLIFIPKHYGEQKITLDSLNIRVPQEGIYIGLQYAMYEVYEWPHTVTLTGKDYIPRDTTFQRYGTRISSVYNGKVKMAYWNNWNNKWEFNSDNFAFKFEAILVACKEK